MRRKNNALSVSVEGTGPTVVLLHGYMSNSAYWQPTTDILKSTHRIVRIDLLGFGKSPKPRNMTYSIDTQLKWVGEAIDKHIGANEKFILAGHSMGGLIASAYAAKHQQRIEKLLLLNMPLFDGREQAQAEIKATRFFYRFMLYTRGGLFAIPLLRIVFALFAVRYLVPKQIRAIPRVLFTNSAASRKGSLTDILEAVRGTDLLQDLNVPTTLIMGDRDRAIYRHNLAKVQLPAFVNVKWFDYGHHIPLIDPKLVAEHARS